MSNNPRNNNKPITTLDIQYVRLFAQKKMPIIEIANRLGRTELSIAFIARNNNINITKSVR